MEHLGLDVLIEDCLSFHLSRLRLHHLLDRLRRVGVKLIELVGPIIVHKLRL